MTTTFIDAGDREAVDREISGLREWSPRGLDVAVAYGGLSAEDRLYLAKSPVDQLSVTALREALTALGARVRVLDPTAPGFVAQLAGPGVDVVLPNLHGPFGEDGRLQGLLDYLRVPYCGSGVPACAVAADKILCKEYMRGLGVPTPDWREWTGQALGWHGPVMVKPPLGGSSVGMNLVREEDDFARALAEAAETDPSPAPRVLVEEIVTGTPVTVGLLELPGGVLVFPPLATEVGAGQWYDAETKLDAAGDGDMVSVSAADLPARTVTALTAHARVLWERLGCRGMARVDFMVDGDGHPFGLEVNPTPGMSAGSNFAAGAELCGISHAETVRAVLHEAMTRHTYDVPLSPDPLLIAG
ncbi:D-alanine--D-alanine ligase family protein [Streptomyces sp. NPDC002276]